MSSKKIITVFGATGVVGGSVAKYLLEDGQFAVRAVTRSATSDKAKGKHVHLRRTNVEQPLIGPSSPCGQGCRDCRGRPLETGDVGRRCERRVRCV